MQRLNCELQTLLLAQIKLYNKESEDSYKLGNYNINCNNIIPTFLIQQFVEYYYQKIVLAIAILKIHQYLLAADSCLPKFSL